jgi:hypothetical protein
MRKMRPALGAAVMLLAGCASHSGVVPAGQGSYMISKQAATGFPGLGNLKAEALQEANQHCLSEGRELVVTNSTETQPPYDHGELPQGERRVSLCEPALTRAVTNEDDPATGNRAHAALVERGRRERL